MISAAEEGKTTNYDVIDNMGDFGMSNYATMEGLWKHIKQSTTVELTTQDLKSTKEGLRSADTRPKSARSRL